MKRKEKILIVDDERSNLNALIGLLKPKYRIMVAKDGNTALQAATSAQPPDLILLDIMMPGLDGYETIQRLKNNESTKDIPVIFLTGKGNAEDEMRGLEMGAVDYIVKPVTPAIVLARVRTHLRLKRKISLLEQMVALDGLTEIPNRRAWDGALERQWKCCQRDHMPLSLLMMDVDNFKQYNDNYGHRAGDDCLVAIAQVLTRCVCRPADFVARYGGEEFAAILSDTDPAAARVVGERIRVAVEGLRIPHIHNDAASVVTISLGVSTCIPPAAGDPQALLKQADVRLYLAKEQGRNCLVDGATGSSIDKRNESHG